MHESLAFQSLRERSPNQLKPEKVVRLTNLREAFHH
jgi:hypothetical protein